MFLAHGMKERTTKWSYTRGESGEGEKKIELGQGTHNGKGRKFMKYKKIPKSHSRNKPSGWGRETDQNLNHVQIYLQCSYKVRQANWHWNFFRKSLFFST